ncbi:MAG: Copper-sensing transcriptional repressor CsoR [Pseudomonadota bacterium]|jgi:DNA-binding FrmR family transcriptional regulator
MPANKTAVQASPTPVTGAAVQRSEHQRDIVNRLRRIEGQVRALAEMVEAGRPCEDIAQQMSAARKAMDKAFYRLMACSMLEAVSQGDSVEGVERSTRILEKYA